MIGHTKIRKKKPLEIYKCVETNIVLWNYKKSIYLYTKLNVVVNGRN